MSEEYVCPTCDGDGEVATSHKFTCYTCKGAGKLYDKEAYDKALEEELEMLCNLRDSVTAMEYQQMGG